MTSTSMKTGERAPSARLQQAIPFSRPGCAWSLYCLEEFESKLSESEEVVKEFEVLFFEGFMSQKKGTVRAH